VPIGLVALATGIRYVGESTAPDADRLDLPGAGVPSFFFIFLLTPQVGFGYQAVAAGAVTLALAVMVAVGSARSAAVVRRLGTWTLLAGCALLAIGLARVMWQLHWAGSRLHGYRLSPSLIVAGSGAGLVLAPLTSVILAGIRPADAGAASGVLATAQQVGAAAAVKQAVATAVPGGA
jgi:hypothetical protein